MYRIVFSLILAITAMCSPVFVHCQSTQEIVRPYLLTDSHPLKKRLDLIFSIQGILKNRDSLMRCGFNVSPTRKWNNLYVAKHSILRGYVIKLFVNEQQGIQEWDNWIARIEGAWSIQAAIERHGYQKFFKVPKKWIYQLPSASLKDGDKQYVLIVEDMDIHDEERNRKKWKDMNYVTKERLDALYCLLKEEGLIDSIYIDNIPISRDGLITFIDTEHVHAWPVNYSRLNNFVPLELKAYWKTVSKQ